VWMVGLVTEQLRGELRWLRKLERELPRRAGAKNNKLNGSSALRT
jgi:hypothetical protein